MYFNIEAEALLSKIADSDNPFANEAKDLLERYSAHQKRAEEISELIAKAESNLPEADLKIIQQKMDQWLQKYGESPEWISLEWELAQLEELKAQAVSRERR